jgi:hypothetical protein
MDFNSIINWVIPIGIVLFVVSIIYGSMKPMFDKFFSFLGDAFRWFGGKAGGAGSKAAEYTTQIVYRQ